MEFKQIQELIKAINKSNISELSIKDGEFQITIKQVEPDIQYTSHHLQMQPALQPPPHLTMPAAAHIPPPSASAPVVPQGNGVAIKSPMIGTFYRSASPDKPALVNVGDEIKQGQVLCVIEAMKLFNEIESEVSGRITKVLVDDASPVEYDQPLFLVEPI